MFKNVNHVPQNLSNLTYFYYMKTFLNFLLMTVLIGSCIIGCTTEPEIKNNPQEETVAEDPDITKSRFDKAIKEAPNDHKLYFQRANYYYELEGYDQAIGDLKKAISIDSSYLNYHASSSHSASSSSSSY